MQFCLQTHAHADHLDLSHLNSRSPEHGTIAPLLHFYASAETLDAAAQTFERDLADFPLLAPESQQRLNLELYAIQPFEPFELGSYTAIAFPANHDPAGAARCCMLVFLPGQQPGALRHRYRRSGSKSDLAGVPPVLVCALMASCWTTTMDRHSRVAVTSTPTRSPLTLRACALQGLLGPAGAPVRHPHRR